MTEMNKVERVLAVVRGEQPDRPPVSFWHHFAADQRSGHAAVKAHLKHLDTYDIDFLKVMFDLGYPHDTPIRSIADLAGLTVTRGDAGVFGEHLATIGALASEIGGRAMMVTTIFNAWATLRRLLMTEAYVPGAGPSPLDDPRTVHVAQFAAQDRAAVAAALAVIGESLANFAAQCIEAGADGIFLSVRDDWLESVGDGPGTYDELVRSTDAAILAGASQGRFNLLHVCGKAVNFAAFAEYPVHAINWADRTAGPQIGEVVQTLTPAPCGGLNHLAILPGASVQSCVEEVHDAVAQAGDRPIIIAPGCTFDPTRVPPANLAAVRRAVDQL
ncbi:MAG: uroporphyrinogen decarboxylase family protein [Phycisphaerae bacterium]